MNGHDELPELQVRPSAPMLLLGAVTAVLSAYGLYGLMTLSGALPPVLAAAAIAGLDVFAIACGKHAIDLARDGDSPVVWNGLVVAVGALSAAAQYAHVRLVGGPPIAGAVMAAFPAATIALYEGALRRAARLSGRAVGIVAQPRATFELWQWLMFPRAAWLGFRMAIADRGLSSDAAFKLGMIAAAHTRTPRARRRAWDVDPVTVLAAVVGAPAITADTSGSDQGSAGGRPVSTAELVRAAIAGGAETLDDVTAVVRRQRPDAPADTIRRARDRVLGQAS